MSFPPEDGYDPDQGSAEPQGSTGLRGTRAWRAAAASFVRGGVRRWTVGGLCALALGAAAQTPPVERLRVVGGLAGINQFTRHEEPFWTRDFARLTQGEASAEIIPYDQAGLNGAEVLRAVQMGSVSFGTLLLSTTAVAEPELARPDLAMENPDFASIERTVAANRTRLSRLLRERYDIELLAIYLYPAQTLFCAKPFNSLADLAGRRIRVSSATQADFVSAVGGHPLQFPFAQIVSSVRAGTADCAITGTMSGNTIGLHEVTSHISPMAINWGLSAFVVNRTRWQALKPSVRQVIERELPKLERAIWEESGRETADGLACNTGSPQCRSGRKGAMKLVPVSQADEKLRLDILNRTVLPAFQKRCGEGCGQVSDSSGRPVAPKGR